MFDAMLRWMCAALFALLCSTSARAETCDAAITPLAFGVVDVLGSAPTDSRADITLDCKGGGRSAVFYVCISIGAGSGGADAGSRFLARAGGGAPLRYQLYHDAARTSVWGSATWPYGGVVEELALPGGISVIPLYGRAFGAQPGIGAGAYSSAFSPAHVIIRSGFDRRGSCMTGTGKVTTASFSVAGAVEPNCLVQAQALDFGSTGVLQQSVDAASTLSVLCTASTSYAISLGLGLSAVGGQRFMRQGGEGVSYNLYRNAARSLLWGTGSATVSGTGNGLSQPYSVYGRVPQQTTPSPGAYTDSVVVTIVY